VFWESHTDEVRPADLCDADLAISTSPVAAGRLWPRFGLALILVTAVVLRGWHLGASGFITPYYLAGVRSMMVSWHNFFFNAFDPAGFLSVDKPPVAFWIQTGSAEFFGFGAISALLPQLVEGVVSIAVLYYLVRRVFGTAAGLFAALFLALTPIDVAVDRSNNTEPCLVLMLLLAAWALSRAVETGKAPLLLLAAGLVGIGFNTKMLMAFGTVPVFILLYLVGAHIPLLRRVGHLAAAGAVLAVVSASWTVVDELTPPLDRPFVDSTLNNSMLELVVGHNGIQRFVRRARGLEGNAPAATAASAAAAASTGGAPDRTLAPNGGWPASRDYTPAGPLRLASPHLAAQIGWLFPLALLGGIAAWRRANPRWPLGRDHLSLGLWAGWALCYGIVFSAAGGLFHAYYLVVMAPALAALAGTGTVALWSLYGAGGTRALLFPAALIATALWQSRIVAGYLASELAVGDKWLVPALIGAIISMAAGLVALRPTRRAPALVLTGVAVSILLALPTAWSVGTVLVKGNTGFPAARPPFLNDAAETQRRHWGLVAGALDGDPRLIAFLRENRRNEEYLLASVNARQAAPIIIATGDRVMAVGGFTGRNPILTVDGFARLVEDKRVRFALVGDGGPGLRRIFGEDGQKPLVDWIRGKGRLVEPARWRTAGPGRGSDGADGRAAEAVGAQLYDLRPTEDGN
jgi:4-amino-4-deoxy-L-arabinose transferase-like glycosyltransferase